MICIVARQHSLVSYLIPVLEKDEHSTVEWSKASWDIARRDDYYRGEAIRMEKMVRRI